MLAVVVELIEGSDGKATIVLHSRDVRRKEKEKCR